MSDLAVGYAFGVANCLAVDSSEVDGCPKFAVVSCVEPDMSSVGCLLIIAALTRGLGAIVRYMSSVTVVVGSDGVWSHFGLRSERRL